MTESVETTIEEASRCPKCQNPCKLASKKPARGKGVTRGAILHLYTCENDRCKWNGQVARVVQINPDGTIPTPVRRDKDYPKVPDLTKQVNDMLENALERQLEGGAEIRRQ